MPKPKYHDLTGFEPSPPPFFFRDVSSRVFPLRASPRRLQRFCDRYLNMAPEISHCRPLAPLVMLSILRYGRMEGESAGWISQNEVVFSFLVRWQHRGPDGAEQTEVAVVTPFIFVDDPLSQTTGREVYGWPKIKAWFEPEIRTWGQDVVSRPRLMRMNTLVFPRAYEGQRPRRRTLLEIDVEPLSGMTDQPPDFRFLWEIGRSLRRGLDSFFRSSRDWTELLLMGAGPWSFLPLLSQLPTPRLARMPRAGVSGPPDSGTDLGPDLTFSVLTLKQFPKPATRRIACYQALISSDMAISRFKRWGLLGEPTLFRGDPTGGFVLRLHRHPEFPIVDALGLDVEHWVETPDPLEEVVRGVTRGPVGSQRLTPFHEVSHSVDNDHAEPNAVAILRPVSPYWLDADLDYGRGRTVCWRATDSDWTAGEEPGPPTDEPLPYNTASGDIVVPHHGPFTFRNVTVRALILRADRERLQELVNEYLNEAQDLHEMEVVTGRVCLASISYEGTESESNDVGWWADREVGFWLVLKRAGEKESDEGFRYSITAPFLFGNSPFAALTLRESFGVPTLWSEIESPPDAWMSHHGPATDRPHLRLSTPIFPTTTGAQRARRRTLLEILSNRARDDRKVEPEDLPDPELLRSLELLGRPDEHGEMWARTIFLRRFRDATEPERACFQSLMLGSAGLRNIDPHLLDPDCLEVRIHHHPSHPLVSRLGLEVDEEQWERRPSDRPGRAWEGRPVQVLRPELAFWITADVHTGYHDQEVHLYPPPAKLHG